MARKVREVRERVLELSTLAPAAHRYVAVDEKHYDLLEPDEVDAIGLARLQQVQHLAEVVNEIDWDDPSDEDVGKADALNSMAEKAVRLLLPDMPDSVRKRLSFYQKMSIIQVFRTTPAETETTPEENQEDPSTGESGVPASSDSTEAETPESG